MRAKLQKVALVFGPNHTRKAVMNYSIVIAMLTVNSNVYFNADIDQLAKVTTVNEITEEPLAFPVKPMNVAKIKLSELPSLGDFNPNAYITAAAKLQKLKREQALATLSSLCIEKDHGNKVIVLCQMLFTSQTGNLRKPILGSEFTLGGIDGKEQKLGPIELVDGIPFSVTYGYSLQGVCEHPVQYLNYCIRECKWNSLEFSPKTPLEVSAAADKLMAKYEKRRLSKDDIKFISKQASNSK